MDATTNRLFLSRHVLFDENHHVPPIPPDVPPHSSHSLLPSVSPSFIPVPCSSSVSMPPHQSLSSTQEGDTTIAASSSGNIYVPQSLLHQLPSKSNPSPSDLLSSSPINPTPLNPSAPVTSSSRVHPMITRSMHNIFKSKQINLVSKHPLPETIEPSTVTQALSNPQWCTAMSSELTALMRHDTWELVPCSASIKPVGCKWVFWVKRHPDGSIDKFKARLVAKGYNQCHGLDYTSTFNPVVKPATIRTILTTAVMHGWNLWQMDVHNAFLHGELFETVFMLQPSGFKDSSKPHHGCRLKKAIYGLKQAPRAWFTNMVIFYLIQIWWVLKTSPLPSPLANHFNYKMAHHPQIALSIATLLGVFNISPLHILIFFCC